MKAFLTFLLIVTATATVHAQDEINFNLQRPTFGQSKPTQFHLLNKLLSIKKIHRGNMSLVIGYGGCLQINPEASVGVNQSLILSGQLRDGMDISEMQTQAFGAPFQFNLGIRIRI